MKNTVEAQQKPSSAPLPINIHTDASSAEILCSTSDSAPPSYTSPASAKDLLDFHSPSIPQILAVHLTSSLFKICQNVIQFKFNQLTARWCFGDRFWRIAQIVLF